MDNPNRIAQNFERFNTYAAEAAKCNDDADVYAALAIAFEISQLRYQLSRLPVDRRAGTGLPSADNGR